MTIEQRAVKVAVRLGDKWDKPGRAITCGIMLQMGFPGRGHVVGKQGVPEFVESREGHRHASVFAI